MIPLSVLVSDVPTKCLSYQYVNAVCTQEADGEGADGAHQVAGVVEGVGHGQDACPQTGLEHVE